MKKFNLIMGGVTVFYLAALLLTGIFMEKQSEEKSREYLVEVNRIMYGLEEEGGFSEPDLREMRFINRVTFLNAGEMGDLQKSEGFFHKKNGMEICIQPLSDGGKMLGFVRFDYQNASGGKGNFWLAEGIILFSGIFMLIVLLYIRNKLIKPFFALRDMPYELAKGHLQTEIEENKSRFFGKFVWGISMLKDNLKASQVKALKLEKEKKMLLLSVSHDIKTPLNSIKLYAKALKEGLYDTEDKQVQAAGHIEKLSGEIEGFVQDIVKSSSEEIITVEVETQNFI